MPDSLFLLVLMIVYGFVHASAVLCFKQGLIRSGEIKLKHNSLNSLIRQIRIILSEKYWVLGGVLAIGGWIVYLVALAFFEISIVKPLTNISIIVLIIGAIIVYREKVKLTEWIGVGGLFLASILLSLNAEEKPGKEVINQFFFLLMLLATLFLLIPLITTFSFASGVQNKEKLAIPFALFSGTYYGIGGLFTNVMLLYFQEPIVFIFTGSFFLFSYAVALVAGQMSIVSGRLSIVYTVETTVIILVSVIGGSFVFNELLFSMNNPVGSVIRIASITAIVFCIFLLRLKVEYQAPMENPENVT
ncbi:MAG: hypothetical protein ACFFD4_25055 [Candidatus Odinarchaeota archaeon]